VEVLREAPATSKSWFDPGRVSKSLERIADHATNVAEDVVYLCEAQDIRHTGVKSQAAPPTGA
jgi:phosphate transport system protein